MRVRKFKSHGMNRIIVKSIGHGIREFNKSKPYSKTNSNSLFNQTQTNNNENIFKEVWNGEDAKFIKIIKIILYLILSIFALFLYLAITFYPVTIILLIWFIGSHL